MGAVRALRHPDRYGPRRRRFNDGDSYVGQSRARGLTRAILDTFPVVKFNGSEHDQNESPVIVPKDLESRPQSMGPDAMGGWEVMDVPLEMIERGDGKDDIHQRVPEDVGEADVTETVPPRRHQRASISASNGASYVSPGPSRPQSSTVPSVPRMPVPSGSRGQVEDVVPEAIGKETCPICIVDFEEGDDLRLLPCEGKHRFHQECVDPWLLELSSSCPICRQDFQALETMLSGESEESYNASPRRDSALHPSHSSSQPQGRFSRYLRFARRRRNEIESAHGHEQAQHDAQERTESPVPALPDN